MGDADCGSILFGIIASLVSAKFGIPDILESIRNIFIYFADGVAIRNKRQRIAYHREEHGNQPANQSRGLN